MVARGEQPRRSSYSHLGEEVADQGALAHQLGSLGGHDVGVQTLDHVRVVVAVDAKVHLG